MMTPRQFVEAAMEQLRELGRSMDDETFCGCLEQLQMEIENERQLLSWRPDEEEDY